VTVVAIGIRSNHRAPTGWTRCLRLSVSAQAVLHRFAAGNADRTSYGDGLDPAEEAQLAAAGDVSGGSRVA
jgi:hypothetical protein